MATFVEVKTERGTLELINTDIIETVYVHEGKTILKFSLNNSYGAASMKVQNTYDEIKGQIIAAQR